jgi:DNA-binding NarL/FixJ family response regulator
VHTAHEPPPLTGEQAALLRLAGQGLTTTAIARELGLTVAVTKHRFAATCRILGARDRSEALIKAARMGLVE